MHIDISNLKKRILTVLFVTASMVFFSVTAVQAGYMGDVAGAPLYDDPSDTKEKLDEAERQKEEKKAELEAAQLQLQSTQENLTELEGLKGTYEGELAVLNGQMQEVADNLAVIEAELALKEIELSETQQALDETEALCEQQYYAMKQRIKFMYESSDTMYIDLLVSSGSFGEFLNYSDYIEDLEEYDRMMLETYQQTLQTISDNKALLEQQLADIQALDDAAVEEQNKVNGLINTAAQNLASTADSIAGVEALADAYEQECIQKQQEKEAADANYAAIKAQYEEELRLSQEAKNAAWRDISEVSFEEGDRYLLANLIYCEAGSQNYEGQLAVGAVVINRVLSSKYPGTVTGVIYQSYQFSPVNDGHLALALAEDRATASCYAAADAAMEGQTNVGNCLYFRTPIEGLTGIAIGGHIFY